MFGFKLIRKSELKKILYGLRIVQNKIISSNNELDEERRKCKGLEDANNILQERLHDTLNRLDACHHEDHEAGLSAWFGLSYASFATLPRVMMQDMPADWQSRMAKCLEELDEAFPNAPDVDFTVRGFAPNGRMTAIPVALTNYRQPDKDALTEWKGLSPDDPA